MTSADADLRAMAAEVADPDLLRGIGELGILGDVKVRRRSVSVTLALPVEGWPVIEELTTRVRDAIGAHGSVGEVGFELTQMTDAERNAFVQRLKPNGFMSPNSRTRVIGVSSGKGGVGKSSVAVNLAVALAARGHEVGLLDADVYGFSVPKMLGVNREPTAVDGLLVAPVVHGVRCLSIGFFVDDEQPVIWRGPMLHKALEQFIVDAYWGEPDFLLIDMPPGTGDVALSLGQFLPRSEVLVVTTPQPAAQRVAQRSAYAAKHLKISVRGVIENLSWFTGDDSKRYELFGRGGGKALADALGVPLLGQVPMVPAVREGGDVGVPVRISDPDGEAAKAFDELAESVVSLGATRIYKRELTLR